MLQIIVQKKPILLLYGLDSLALAKIKIYSEKITEIAEQLQSSSLLTTALLKTRHSFVTAKHFHTS